MGEMRARCGRDAGVIRVMVACLPYVLVGNTTKEVATATPKVTMD